MLIPFEPEFDTDNGRGVLLEEVSSREYNPADGDSARHPTIYFNRVRIDRKDSIPSLRFLSDINPIDQIYYWWNQAMQA